MAIRTLDHLDVRAPSLKETCDCFAGFLVSQQLRRWVAKTCMPVPGYATKISVPSSTLAAPTCLTGMASSASRCSMSAMPSTKLHPSAATTRLC
jgi:hypothetical protein